MAILIVVIMLNVCIILDIIQMNNDTIEVTYWNSILQREMTKFVSFEEIIRAPNGLKMADLGLYVLNIERAKLGLSQVQYNPLTGTYDEKS